MSDKQVTGRSAPSEYTTSETAGAQPKANDAMAVLSEKTPPPSSKK